MVTDRWEGGARPEGGSGEEADARRPLTVTRDLLWPIIIVAALAVVVVVNAVFIYIAVKGADTVVPSYTQGDR